MQAPSPPQPATAPELVARFEMSEGLNDRIGVLRQLAIVGREESVPLLAKLLDDEDPVIRGYALAAAEANPAPAAGAALVTALGKPQDSARKVAVVDALGGRREPTAVAPLAALINDADDSVSSAAIAALGNIGTPSAAARLGGAHWEVKASAAAGDAAAKAVARRKAVDIAKALLVAWDRIAEAARQGGEAPNHGFHRMVHGLSHKGPAADSPIARHLQLASIRGFVRGGDRNKAFLAVEFLKDGTVREQAEAARILVDLGDEDRVTGDSQPEQRFIDVRQRLLETLPKLPPSGQAFLLEALAEREATRSGG